MEKITQFLITANLPHAKIKHKHYFACQVLLDEKQNSSAIFTKK